MFEEVTLSVLQVYEQCSVKQNRHLCVMDTYEQIQKAVTASTSLALMNGKRIPDIEIYGSSRNLLA